MAKVEIHNVEEAREAGQKYGVLFPAGRGRPPMLKLRDAILAAGDEIVPTEYFSGEFKPRVPAAAPGKAQYEIALTEKVTKYVPTEVPAKNGKGTVKVPKKTEVEETRTVRLNVEEIRKLTNGEGLPGKISESRAREAFAKSLGVDVSSLANVVPTRVVEAVQAENRPIKAAKPAKGARRGDNTPDANDLVSADAGGSEEDAA